MNNFSVPDRSNQKKENFCVEMNVEISPSEKDASPAKDNMRKIITKKQTPTFAKQFILKNFFFLLNLFTIILILSVLAGPLNKYSCSLFNFS